MSDASTESSSSVNQVRSFGVSHSALSNEEMYQALLKADKSESLIPLASSLAQEMNDLLTRVMGAVASLPKTDNNYLAQAEEAVLEAREITRRLQSLSQGSDGVKKEVKIQSIFDEIYTLNAGGSVAKIEISVDPRAKSIFVDVAQIKQVFQNLLRNATEAMTPTPHNPKIQLMAQALHVERGDIIGLEAGDYVQCEVRDNGHGISTEISDKVWDPFFTTKKHAAGLGLPTSLEIIRRHGGTIGLTSEVGVGSVFTVFIPVAIKTVQVQAVQAPTARFKTGRILIVDDDLNIRNVLSKMLERLDYRSDSSRDAEDALQQYKRYFDISRPYDAVLVDIKLSGTPGAQLLQTLKQFDPDIRVIALSAEDSTSLAKEMMDLGFCGFLKKPFVLSELGESLSTVIGN